MRACVCTRVCVHVCVSFSCVYVSVYPCVCVFGQMCMNVQLCAQQKGESGGLHLPDQGMMGLMGLLADQRTMDLLI